MSGTPTCEVHADTDAVYIIGMAETGEQLFMCRECGAHFGLTLALQLLDPAEIINAASALKTTPANGESGEAPANKPARKRTPKAARPKPTSEPKPGVSEATPPADDR
jgi:hypothetical protein